MKNLTALLDKELNDQVKALAQEERNLVERILVHIVELDRRQLYLKMAYPSLFEYLTQEIGYSAGSAQRRIDAARLSQKLPEVLARVQDGSINLSQISKVQKIGREVKRETGNPVSVQVQRSVMKKLEHKGARETDLILAQEFEVTLKTDERKHIQKDESVRVELTFSKEEMELLEKARCLLSHQTGGNLKGTLIEMARKIVKASEPKLKPKAPGKESARGSTEPEVPMCSDASNESVLRGRSCASEVAWRREFIK